ncbi:MAG: Glu/Leu/Phe/Val dehydrogenase dimerization domain-containing protein [Sutterellaceae bacterium]|nr:hypothetical protein [Burkholderiaceae bacterium]MCX7901119.1 hypothetical protein [Burkholderiaceae bacterium]MDW8430982.1 Glu/Leu/Phe/Val dehydrogenase dimerization domain-containing protein [Sutterellaceae bacterium]
MKSRTGVPVAPSALSAATGSWTIFDDKGDPLGFVAIDRIVAGRSCGGIRAGPSVTLEEIERIARVMTLKCGFAGLAAGGAKGGIIMPADARQEDRLVRLQAFGRGAAALLRSGVWSHGADMGTTEQDIAWVRYAAGLGGGAPGASRAKPPVENVHVSSGTAAGWTVALATEAALQALEIPLARARVAIQGVGTVGRAAAGALAATGARVVALSTLAGAVVDPKGLEVSALLRDSEQRGDAFTAGCAPRDALLDVACDALLLCAGTDALSVVDADRLQVRAVICGANLPFSAEVEQRLRAREVLVIPDFVASAGGVLGSTLIAMAGVTADELKRLLRQYFLPRVAVAIERARTARGSIADVAERMAWQLIAACEAAYADGERPEGLLPARLAAPSAAALRLLQRAERRLRDSPRLAWPARMLRRVTLREVERVLAATLALAVGT